MFQVNGPRAERNPSPARLRELTRGKAGRLRDRVRECQCQGARHPVCLPGRGLRQLPRPGYYPGPNSSVPPPSRTRISRIIRVLDPDGHPGSRKAVARADGVPRILPRPGRVPGRIPRVRREGNSFY